MESDPSSLPQTVFAAKAKQEWENRDLRAQQRKRDSSPLTPERLHAVYGREAQAGSPAERENAQIQARLRAILTQRDS